ncbi:MAG: VWA domain-containing protein, partial [Pseudomonadota bacterium]
MSEAFRSWDMVLRHSSSGALGHTLQAGLTCVIILALAFATTLALSTRVDARTGSHHGKPITVEAQLSQSVVPDGGAVELYLRLGIKARRPANTATRPPLNIALVLDKSGSMGGARIREARSAALMAVDRLGRDDALTVVSYDSVARVLVQSQTLAHRERLKRRIGRLGANGSTAIYDGLTTAADEMATFVDPDRVSRIILLSDGQANVGPRDPAAFADLGRDLAARGIIVSTIGLGSGYNEDLMAQLAQSGEGNHAFVSEPQELVAFFDREFNDATQVVAQDVEVIITFSGDVEPVESLGRKARRAGRTLSYRLGQLIGGSEHVLVSSLRLPNAVRSGRVGIASVAVRFRSAETGVDMRTETHVSVTTSPDGAAQNASRNADVMEDVTLLEARAERARAIKLRDGGREQEAQAVFKAAASRMTARQKAFGFDASDRFAAEQRANEAAAAPATPQQWRTQRKTLRALESN